MALSVYVILDTLEMDSHVQVRCRLAVHYYPNVPCFSHVVSPTSGGSESSALTIGALFGAFGIFIFFFCVASMFAIICLRHKGIKNEHKHLSDRGACKRELLGLCNPT